MFAGFNPFPPHLMLRGGAQIVARAHPYHQICAGRTFAAQQPRYYSHSGGTSSPRATDMDERRLLRQPARKLATLFTALACACLHVPADATVFRCVDVNGANTYSDRPCAPPEADRPEQADATGTGGAARTADGAKVKKAARVLDLLRIAPAEPETFVLQRTVDDAAPDLVKALDPDNAVWTPANPKWHSVLEFVKGDLRQDVQTALRRSTAETARVTAQTFAARADEADLDATLGFLESGDGARYLALQNQMREVLYDALASLLAQESVPTETPDDATLHRRQEILSLTVDYRILKDGGGPPPADLEAGSAAVMEYSARHDGQSLDALVYEYGPYLPHIRSFADSPLGKRLFRALEPAVRTYLALSSTATTDFAEAELDRYFFRWRAVYGPPLRSAARTTVIIRGRVVAISRTTQLTVSAAGSAEGMAIVCEQREDSTYKISHRLTEANAQAAALKTIQNRCRAEQHLPPL
jgi:uncharacterized protein DUF4124